MHDWTLAVIAAILLGYAACSAWLRRTPITPAMVFVTAGYLVGSHGFGLISERSSASGVRLLAEATLTVVLFTDASRIDPRALRVDHLLPSRLLGIGLPLTVLLGGVVAAGLFGGLSLPEAMLLAVVLAPTDAALGQAVVTDARLPSRVRQALNVESGLNDGICVPLLFIFLALAEADASTISSTRALRLIGEAIGFGVLGGVVAGALAALLLSRIQGGALVERLWVKTVPPAAAALAYGLAAPIGGSGFIAAFVAGWTYGTLAPGHDDGEVELAEQIGEVLNAATFVLFGAVLLGPTIAAFGWRTACYAVLSLTLIRLLPVAIALAGTHARRQTVGFLGWFGPRGLASIVFAVIIIEESRLPGASTILAAIFTTVALSVFAHGLSAQFLTDRYARWYHAHPPDRRPAMESVPSPHHRWRRAHLGRQPDSPTPT